MDILTSEEVDFLVGLVEDYLEKELDLNQREWGFARGVLDKLNAELEVKGDA